MNKHILSIEVYEKIICVSKTKEAVTIYNNNIYTKILHCLNIYFVHFK